MAPGAGHETQIRACLERVLASSSFAASKRRGELLRYLVERALSGQGETVTEYGIALDVFGKPPSFDPRRESTVRAEMTRLRRSLAGYYENGGASDPWRLQFPARGYAVTALPNLPEPNAAPAVASSPPPGRRWLWRAAAFPLLALAAWGAWTLWQAKHSRDVIRAAIVLPFANLTGDPASEYLADGLTEDLTDSLAHIATLRVVARTSAFQFKGKAADIREIGRRQASHTVGRKQLRKIGEGATRVFSVNSR